MATTLAGSSLAKHLASCNKTTRDKALHLLKTWLPSQTQVPDDEMKKIWKGLFYCVWHADKQQFQIELINRLSSLLVSLNLSLSIHYFEAFLLTIRREWSGIDYLRLDKFYLLIRRFLHHLFLLFKKNSWDLELVSRLMGVLEENTLLSGDNFPAHGVNYHLAEVFLEELKCFLPLKLEAVEVLVKPFVSVLRRSLDKVLLNKIKSSLFGCLLENGKTLLERRKVGDGSQEGGAADDVELFGTMALTLRLSRKFFELGSSPDCVQGNRKVFFALQMDFVKLEKDLANSGVVISIPQVTNENNEDEVPELILITQEAGVSDEEVEPGVQVANEAANKPSKKIKKARKSEASVEQVEEKQLVANGSTDKLSKKIKKAKNTMAPVEQVDENQVANGSMDKMSKKIKKANKASGESGSKRSKKRRNSPSSSDGEKGNTSNGENSANDRGLITFNESVISNLQMQFEKIAAEVGMDMGGEGNIDSLATPVTMPKKRKRAKCVDGKVSLTDGEGVLGGSAVGKSGEKSAKKVRFSMKNNVVWKPHSPLPPQSLRLPPSATPRGSALKKGIPAGPVIVTPVSKKVKQRSSSLKKARKGLKSVSPSVKRLKKLRSYSA